MRCWLYGYCWYFFFLFIPKAMANVWWDYRSVVCRHMTLPCEVYELVRHTLNTHVNSNALQIYVLSLSVCQLPISPSRLNKSTPAPPTTTTMQRPFAKNTRNPVRHHTFRTHTHTHTYSAPTQLSTITPVAILASLNKPLIRKVGQTRIDQLIIISIWLACESWEVKSVKCLFKHRRYVCHQL